MEKDGRTCHLRDEGNVHEERVLGMLLPPPASLGIRLAVECMQWWPPPHPRGVSESGHTRLSVLSCISLLFPFDSSPVD